MAKKSRSRTRTNSAKRFSQKPLRKGFTKYERISRQLQQQRILNTFASALASYQPLTDLNNGSRIRPNKPAVSKNVISAIHKNIQPHRMPEKNDHYHCRSRPDPNKTKSTGSGGTPNFIPWKGSIKC